MRITQEADYALRISYLLTKDGGLLDAGEISRAVGVTDRFTVKILRKLIQGGITQSQKGAAGGYRLMALPSEVSIRRIVELIDGPLAISRCLGDDYVCSRTGEQKQSCTFHCIFSKINEKIAQQLDTITLDQIIDEHADVDQILSKLQ